MKRFSCLFLLLAAALNASGWGKEGHEAVAELARQMLAAPARSAVERILGNDDLAVVSTWADELKLAKKHQGPLSNDPEAGEMNARFPLNGEWHFADLPLGTTAYRDNDRFANSDDVVHAINHCIHVLEAPPGQRTDLTKDQALKFLVHFVDDIHQPLHCGSGYYDLSGGRPVLITDPEKAYRHQNDKGGNYLRFGKSHFNEVHAFWDDTLVERVAHGPDYRKLARVLKPRINLEGWATPGDYHQWAEAWATESVHEARVAYERIVFETAETARNGKLRLIHVRLPEDYERSQVNRAADQLAKAGVRLAGLLNSVRWQ